MTSAGADSQPDLLEWRLYRAGVAKVQVMMDEWGLYWARTGGLFSKWWGPGDRAGAYVAMDYDGAVRVYEAGALRQIERHDVAWVTAFAVAKGRRVVSSMREVRQEPPAWAKAVLVKEVR